MKEHGERRQVDAITLQRSLKDFSESMIKLGNQLNHRQNLVSALQPIPVLISEAIMHFQEKRDYITNKVRCGVLKGGVVEFCLLLISTQNCLKTPHFIMKLFENFSEKKYLNLIRF